MESDEHVLAHISANGGNLPRAKYGALALVGCGRGLNWR